MARRLTLCAFVTAGLLAGCSSLTQTSTLDALEMQRNALRAYEGGEDAKAEALYLGLIRISPSDPETWLRLGNLYARSNRPDNAADAYQRALLLAPHDERLWYNLGIIRLRQAHASFIQAQQTSQQTDDIHIRSEALIKQLAPVNDGANGAQAGNDASSGK